MPRSQTDVKAGRPLASTRWRSEKHPRDTIVVTQRATEEPQRCADSGSSPCAPLWTICVALRNPPVPHRQRESANLPSALEGDVVAKVYLAQGVAGRHVGADATPDQVIPDRVAMENGEHVGDL